MEVFGKGRIRKSELFALARLTRAAFWTGIEFLKGNKKIDMITTNDLDDDNKLYPNYLERRKQRKELAKKKKDSPFKWSR